MSDGELKLSAIHCYPIKSARGIAVQSATVDRFGLVGDRRWMLVDSSGKFLSQRTVPTMALLEVAAEDGGIHLTWDGESIDVAIPDPRGDCVIAQVWEDTIVAPLADAGVNDWLSARFHQPVRLVHCPDTALRGVEPGYAPPGQLVAFSDGFPLLVISEASLALLNEKLPCPVPMNRFRPNLVIAGAEPHDEDSWRTLRIGGASVSLVKPCSRCAMPSIDQGTAERDPHINRALAAYRRRDGVIYFGMNAISEVGATFRVGQIVEIVD